MTIKRPAAAVLIILGTLNVFGDDITLKNGDRVSGKIVEQTDDWVTVETEYAGKVKIGRAFITRIVAKAAPSAPAEKANTATAAKKDEAPPSPPPPSKARLFGGRFMGLADGWEGNANIGFSYTSGNSNITTLSTGLRAVKNGGSDKLSVYVRSHWHSNHGTGQLVTTQNAFWGGGRYDRNLKRRVFGFVSYDFERDRPKKLNFRSVVGGGLGHHVVKNDRTEVDVLAGAGWNRTWQAGPNTDTPEALFGAVLKHRFNERIRAQQTSTYYQNMTALSSYRFLFDASISADVTKRIGFFVTVGDRFNNKPAGTAKRNDFLFTTGMKWNFGKKK
ncbi:MAG: DUF481 domain-containing protein [Pyrinomonadaceae bacterium]